MSNLRAAVRFARQLIAPLVVLLAASEIIEFCYAMNLPTSFLWWGLGFIALAGLTIDALVRPSSRSVSS